MAFLGCLVTITMPRIGTPRRTTKSKTLDAVQAPTLLGRLASVDEQQDQGDHHQDE